MRPFTYERATDQWAALGAVAQPGAKFISGGTNLLDLMKLEIERPTHLVDISRLPLKAIEELPNGGLRVGAQATNSQLAADPHVRTRYPILSQAVVAGASGQLRNMASVGGNLLQRTRCPYFYDTSAACNKREPGHGCSAMEGFNRNHAILGASDLCIATNPSDMSVALAVLDAEIDVIGADHSATRIPIEEFHLLPGDTPHIETALKPGEMITDVILPPPPPGAQLYRKVRDRASYEFALVSVGVILATEHGEISTARVAFGGVAAKPWRSADAERELVGRPPIMATFKAAAKAAVHNAVGRGYNAFKIDLLQRTLCRTLAQAVRAE
ncbi:MAG TPA: xanthine dehydrogenase family protein subunit M [Gemmatimonadaceae bacterium]|nr:xanthine dehydrogenase family protein subunit M [Gemmatimonadaceae bacterium]